MIVAFSKNRKYRVRFQTRRVVQCSIRFIGKNETDHSVVATGTATCCPLDVFDEEEGQKKSLTRALAGFPKKVRETFWHTFLTELNTKNLKLARFDWGKKQP